MYFDVPASQVRIGLEILGNTAASLWPSLLIGFLILPLCFYYWPPTQAGFYSIYLGFLLILATAKVTFSAELPFLNILPILIGVFFAYIGSVYRHRGRVLNRAGRLPQLYDARSEILRGTIAEYFVKNRGFDPLIFILLFFFLTPGIFVFCGWIEGRQLKEPDSFLSNGQLLGIVQVYGDRIISVPLNSNGEVVAGTYFVVPALDVARVESFTTRFEPDNRSLLQNTH
jgi:hypothetical protein